MDKRWNISIFRSPKSFSLRVASDFSVIATSLSLRARRRRALQSQAFLSLRGFPLGKPWQSYLLQQKKSVIAGIGKGFVKAKGIKSINSDCD